MLTPAKVNLYLEVVSKRPDGMHELRTLFFPLPGIADHVSICFNHSRQISISCDSDEVPNSLDNLCGKAALAYCKSAKISGPSFEIQLEKNIPVTAGMGGGSSDAAAVLLQLQSHYGILSEEELTDLAVHLGADVPYFLNPVPAVAKGVGELLTPVRNARMSPFFLFAAPQFPVSAAWAYQHLDWEAGQKSTGSLDGAISALETADWHALALAMRNDLEYALLKKFPVLNLIREQFYQTGALRVMVSGSGPTQFAIYETSEQRNRALMQLKQSLDPSIRLI